MSAGTSRRALLAVALIGFAVGLVVSVRFDLFPSSQAINLFGGGEKAAEESGSTGAPAAVALPDFAGLAEHLSPSVVNISSTQEVKGGPSLGVPGGPGGPGGEGDPFHEFFEPFEKFFGPPRRPYKAKSLGSGFVIDTKGYILTNNHVVENADEIVVKLSSGKEIVPQLKEKGHVTRGWLGVMIQKVTPDIADSLGLPNAKGALVADVVKDGPAEASGIKQGDVIVEYDGKPVNDSAELPLLVARTPVGKTVKLKVIRDKAEQNFTIRIAELKEEEAAQAGTGTAEDLEPRRRPFPPPRRVSRCARLNPSGRPRDRELVRRLGGGRARRGQAAVLGRLVARCRARALRGRGSGARLAPPRPQPAAGDR